MIVCIGGTSFPLDKVHGYNKLFFSPEEIVKVHFEDGSQIKKELARRGIDCPKYDFVGFLKVRKVVQRKKLLINVLRTELGNEVSQTFKTVVCLALRFFGSHPEETDVTSLFDLLFHQSQITDLSSENSWT